MSPRLVNGRLPATLLGCSWPGGFRRARSLAFTAAGSLLSSNVPTIPDRFRCSSIPAHSNLQSVSAIPTLEQGKGRRRSDPRYSLLPVSMLTMHRMHGYGEGVRVECQQRNHGSKVYCYLMDHLSDGSFANVEINLRDRLTRAEQAPFEGWNFSHLDGRMLEDPLPWDYIVIDRVSSWRRSVSTSWICDDESRHKEHMLRGPRAAARTSCSRLGSQGYRPHAGRR
jgi:hypothetical protein